MAIIIDVGTHLEFPMFRVELSNTQAYTAAYLKTHCMSYKNITQYKSVFNLFCISLQLTFIVICKRLEHTTTDPECAVPIPWTSCPDLHSRFHSPEHTVVKAPCI